MLERPWQTSWASLPRNTCTKFKKPSEWKKRKKLKRKSRTLRWPAGRLHRLLSLIPVHLFPSAFLLVLKSIDRWRLILSPFSIIFNLHWTNLFSFFVNQYLFKPISFQSRNSTTIPKYLSFIMAFAWLFRKRKFVLLQHYGAQFVVNLSRYIFSFPTRKRNKRRKEKYIRPEKEARFEMMITLYALPPPKYNPPLLLFLLITVLVHMYIHTTSRSVQRDLSFLFISSVAV